MAHTQPDWNATTGEAEILNKPTVVTNPMASDLDMGNFSIVNLATPASSTDGATKGYVDAFITGLSWKQVARVATTANLVGTYANGASGVGATFTMTSTGVLTVDGVALVLNDRVILKDQTTAFQNGIYKVTTAGAGGIAAILTRSLDADTSAELVSAAIATGTEGSVNANLAFTQTTPATITIGSTTIAFAQLFNNAFTAGTGIRITANVVFAKLSEGVTGGQTAKGGTASEDALTLQGSSSTDPRTTTAPAVIVNSAGALGGSSGAQVFASVPFTVNASGTAGYTGLKIAVTETALGSGTKNIVELLAGGSGTTSKLAVANSGSVTIADSANLIVGSSTGTKIGTATTQKLGFFNTTPVIQQTGDVLTALSNLGLVASPIIPGSTINTQTGTSYTFVLTDAGKMVTSSNASAQTFTVPPQSSVTWAANTQIDIVQLGAGKLTIAAGAGVTINSSGSNKSAGGQYVGLTLKRISSDSWILLGNLIA